jgi:hypothetical protein
MERIRTKAIMVNNDDASLDWRLNSRNQVVISRGPDLLDNNWIEPFGMDGTLQISERDSIADAPMPVIKSLYFWLYRPR